MPYGYKKIEGNKEQWYIDEPAAEIVRKIFNLCISGKGPSQIARQLEAEKVLTPTAYFNSVGKKTSNLIPLNIYGWSSKSVAHILENRQYTGCTVNGKSTTVSYKVHKKIEKCQDDYQIIPNSQEFMRIIFSVSYPMSVIPVWQMNTKLSKSDLYQRLRKMKKLSLNFKSKLLI